MIRVVCAYGGVRCGSVCCMWLPVLLKSAHLCPHFLNILHLLKVSTALSFVFSFARLLGSVNSVQKARLDFSGKILPS